MKIALLSILIFCITQTSYGLQVDGLYEHRVAVANESDSERDRAFEEAFRAVILKVTGAIRWLDHPGIEQAVKSAQSYVESISYVSESRDFLSPGQNDNLLSNTEQRYIEVSFADSLVQELLAEIGVPVWNSNRPSVLVWMVLQNSLGEREVLTSDTNPQIIAYIQSFAEGRGIPIIFPVLDFEDRQNLSEDDIWGFDERKIIEASERYGADSILSGRLHFTASGDLVGLWQFIFQDEASIFDGFDENLEAYLHAPLDRVTNQLASYFGIIPAAGAQQTVRLRVEGIQDFTIYSMLINYLANLGLVDNVSPVLLDGERLDLELVLVGDSAQLYEIIALDRDLLPIESSQIGGRGVLHYRWTR
ncbi:MAG: DUF2066 domain-containing protein [Gammaproteobacteria bacterium]|nr:DUF2066 domain-containing protein [Gammaproteobacteria bacterium]